MRGWFLLFALAGGCFAQNPPALLIDTDGGSDDLMAVAFLLTQPGVRIDAITTVNGLAHVDAGARNMARLVELAGRKDIPVFAGRDTPLRGNAAFPAEWRKASDELPGVDSPVASRAPESRRAVDFLVSRLRGAKRPVRILALGPLTNLAEALERDRTIAASIREIVIMGGAVAVPGNLADGDLLKSSNKTAEWNIFVDPWAARVVFGAGIPIRLIPLDATNKVPLDLAFVREFAAAVHSPLARFVAQVLETDKKAIEDGYFFAWDPLAAVALLHPEVVKVSKMHIDVLQDSPQAGRTVRVAGAANVAVAMDADAVAFRRTFVEAFVTLRER